MDKRRKHEGHEQVNFTNIGPLFRAKFVSFVRSQHSCFKQLLDLLNQEQQAGFGEPEFRRGDAVCG